MIEIIPNKVDSAFLYFHSPCSCGDEMAPFVEEMSKSLSHTYLWAGDGCIEGQHDDPVIGNTVSYAVGRQRYWFVFPMHGRSREDFVNETEAVGAILATSGGYANRIADQVMARFRLPASRIVLCGHQHGSCVALAAAMMRRCDPFALTLLFDPWPLETLYLAHERQLPPTKVVCIDNQWVRERERQRGEETPLYQVFQRYGICCAGVTLAEGQGRPDEFMFREAARQMKALYEICA